MKVVLNKIEKRVTEDSVRILCLIETENASPYTIWYEVQKDFGMYLCDDRADAFLVGLLPYFMAHSSIDDNTEIILKTPISEKLYYQLTTYYIPVLASSTKLFKPVKIIADISSKKQSSVMRGGGYVGAGVSGGVDSFYTLLKHQDTKTPHYNITHGVYFNTGMFGGFDGSGEQKLLNSSKEICNELSIDFISISSNIFIDVYRMIHEAIISPVFISFVLAVQDLFCNYYISSSYKFNEFAIKDYSSAKYDLLNIYCFSTESISFHSSGSEVSRIEKVAFINNFDLPKKKLTVCPGNSMLNTKFVNCSKCGKCSRTILEMEALGILDDFKDVFDIDYFKKHKNYYYGYLFFKGKKHIFTDEIFSCYEKRGKRFGILPRLCGIAKIIKNGFRRSNPLEKTYKP